MDLHATLRELRHVSAEAAATAPDVSAWSVGMHVEHCCLAMIGVCRTLVDSPLPPPPKSFSLGRLVVFLSGRIPRGRAKSPEAAVPSPEVDTERLEALLDRAEQGLEAAAAADPRAWFQHFVFGPLRRDRTLKFLTIHNRHHLRIVREVLAAGGPGG